MHPFDRGPHGQNRKSKRPPAKQVAFSESKEFFESEFAKEISEHISEYEERIEELDLINRDNTKQNKD